VSARRHRPPKSRPSPAGWRSLTGGYALHKFPEHARLIGEIIGIWNDVEEHMAITLGYFLHRKVGMATAMLAGVHSSDARIRVFQAAGLGFFTTKEDRTNFTTCITGLDNALTERNRLAHGVYQTDNKGRLVILNTKYDPTSQQGAKLLTDKSLKEIQAAMSLIHDQLNWHVSRADAILSAKPPP